MNTDKLISVIVPIYNLENYIERCIDSILNQTYENIQIVIIDDGSTDSSYEKCMRQAQKNNRIIVLKQKNQGVTAARINGILHSDGEYIGFVDGDDEIEPNMYERLVANMDCYEADISHCGYRLIFTDGRERLIYGTNRLEEHNREEALKELIRGEFIEPGLCNKLYKASLFKKLQDNLDSSIKINEDLLMNFFLFRNANKAIYEDFCPYHYIVRKGSASRQSLNTNKVMDPIRVKKIILDEADEHIKDVALKGYMNALIYGYFSTATEKFNKFIRERKEIRRYLLDNKKNIAGLPTKTRILGISIVYNIMPMLFLYRLYVKYLQHNIYN